MDMNEPTMRKWFSCKELQHRKEQDVAVDLDRVWK
jgi:hypothetical protein